MAELWRTPLPGAGTWTSSEPGDRALSICNRMTGNRMQDCIFCKIAAGDVPVDKVYEDDTVVAFRDLNPQAPTHLLIVPRRHIATLEEAMVLAGGSEE